MSPSSPPPSPEVVTQDDFNDAWHELDEWQLTSDWLDSALEDRVIRLEHALVSRKARRALLREIRRDDRDWRTAAPTFRARRIAAVTHLFLNRGQR